MKKYEEFINESEVVNSVDLMIEGLIKMNIADNFSIHSFNNNVTDIYEITAEIRVNSGYTTIEGFKTKLDNIEKFMKEDFNFHRSNIGNALRNGNIGLVYTMTEEELKTSKGFTPYITVDKYDL